MPGKRRGPPRKDNVIPMVQNTTSTERERKRRDLKKKKNGRGGGGVGGGGGDGPLPPTLTAGMNPRDVKAPDYFTMREVELWQMTRDHLCDKGWLEIGMIPLLQMYVRTVYSAELAMADLLKEQIELRRLEKSALTRPDDKDILRGNPAFRVTRQMMEEAQKIGAMFGLDPWNEARIRTERGISEMDENPFAKIDKK